MKRNMEDLKDMICRELDEIAEKGEMSAGDLDTVYKLIVSKEKLLRIEEIEEDLGYSSAGEWNAMGSYGNGYGNGNSYANRGRHYVRSHYSRGNGRYSMAEGKQMIMEKMRELMNDPEITANDHEVLERAMRELGR